MDSYYRVEKRRGRGRWLLLLILLAGGYGILRMLLVKPQPIVSPIPEESQPAQSVFSLFKREKDPVRLRRTIETIVGDSWKNYSVYVKDFKSDFTIGIDETVTFTAASVNKVPIIAALYQLAQSNDIDLDEKVTIQKEDIQDYGTGSIRYETPGSTYSIRTLAKLAISQSDNTAAYVIDAHIVGSNRVQSLVKQWGLTQTDIVNNKTSNHDMALLFEKIYREQIAGNALTQELLAFFKDTDFEDRLPAKLPKSASVYHKIGNEIGNVHDVGIVVDGNTAYYIGILTSDITNEEEAVRISADISKTIYDTMR